MQKFNWSTVFGCIILAIGIVIGCQSIASAINNNRFASHFPNYLEVYHRGDAAYGDFLYDYEAAQFLKVHVETLMQWVQDIRLEGAYIIIERVEYDENGHLVKDGEEYIFSKEKLTEFMNGLMY